MDSQGCSFFMQTTKTDQNAQMCRLIESLFDAYVRSYIISRWCSDYRLRFVYVYLECTDQTALSD